MPDWLDQKKMTKQPHQIPLPLHLDLQLLMTKTHLPPLFYSDGLQQTSTSGQTESARNRESLLAASHSSPGDTRGYRAGGNRGISC